MAGKSNKLKTDIAFKKLATGKVTTRLDFSEFDEQFNTFIQNNSNQLFGETIPTTGLPTTYGDTDAGNIVQFVSFSLVPVPGTDYDANDFEDSADGLVDNTNNNDYHAFYIQLLSDYESESTTHGAHNRLGEDAFINSGILTGSNRTQLVPSSYGNSYQLSLKTANGTLISLASDEQEIYIDYATGIVFRQDVPNSANTPVQGTGYLYVGKFIDEIISEAGGNLNIDDGTNGFSLGSATTASFETGSGAGLTISSSNDGTNSTLTFELVGVLSSSAQIATDISGAINSATESILNNYGLLSSSAQIATDISGAFTEVSSSIVNTITNVSNSIAAEINTIEGNITELELSASAGIFFSGSNGGYSIKLTETASFEDGGAGLSVVSVSPNKIQIGKATDNVTFNNIIITNTASISYLETIYETASVIYTSGSTKFGNSLDDNHWITGSIYLTGGFNWDKPAGSNLQIPLVYDAATGNILTGSQYALAADGMTQFQISGSTGGFDVTEGETISFISGGVGLEINANTDNTVTFTLTDGVVSGSSQITISETTGYDTFVTSISGAINSATESILNNYGLLSSSAQIASEISGAFTSTSASIASDITTNETNITELQTSASAGIYFSASVGGGHSISLTQTASFIGGDGITVTNNEGTITIESDYGELDSPIYINASGDTGTSIEYGATASFSASGPGLTVSEDTGEINYDINANTLIEAVDTAITINITSSYAETASQIYVTDNESGDNNRPIVFHDGAAGGYVNLESDASTFYYNPSTAQLSLGVATVSALYINPSQFEMDSTVDSFTLLSTVKNINIGGTVESTVNIGNANSISHSIAGNTLLIDHSSEILNPGGVPVDYEKYRTYISGGLAIDLINTADVGGVPSSSFHIYNITESTDRRALVINDDGRVTRADANFATDLVELGGGIDAISGSSDTQGQVTFYSSSGGIFATGLDVNIPNLGNTGNPTFNSINIDTDATIGGNLTINGTTTTIDTTNLLVEDAFIHLASGSGTTGNGGIIIERATDSTGTALFWDETNDVWAVDVAGASAPNNTATNDANVAFISHSAGLPGAGFDAAVIVGASDDYKKGQFYVDTTDDYGLYVYL